MICIGPLSSIAQVSIMKTDEILAINFKPVKEMEKLFRSRNGRNLLIDVLPTDRNSKGRIITTLEQRI